MNRGLAENTFRAGMATLLADIEGQQASRAADPYAGAGNQVFHEHDTRVYFFDRLLKLLGWKLGIGGNVAEEARIKVNTTKFVDYLGVNSDTRAPVLILEAKSWDKPLIAGRGQWHNSAKPELIVAAIEHINSDGEKKKSPVTGEWHDYLAQLAGYVRMFKTEHEHDVPCAVLSSGQWLLIFKAPVATFCDREVNDGQFLLFEREAYVKNAHKIFEYISCAALADTAPVSIRSPQLGNYVDRDNFKAAYHALLIKYEESGAQLFALQPRILVYPAVVFERTDNTLFNVIDNETPIVMQPSGTGDDGDALAQHIGAVTDGAEALLQSCAEELGIAVVPHNLSDFPGFPDPSAMSGDGLALGQEQKLLIRPLRTAADNWLAVTGHLPHYLLAKPVLKCRFHAWVECRKVNRAIGANAINSPGTETPRAFFVDTEPHHCAHQVIDDRRHDRCHIRAIDARTCCKACIYQDECWSVGESANLPCGN